MHVTAVYACYPPQDIFMPHLHSRGCGGCGWVGRLPGWVAKTRDIALDLHPSRYITYQHILLNSLLLHMLLT